MKKNRSDTDQAKRARRLHRRFDTKRRLQALAAKREFPDFEFQPNGAPEAFVQAVARATQQIDFTDRSRFYDWEAAVYHRIRKVGADKAGARPIRATNRVAEDDVLREHHLVVNLGHQIYALIDLDDLLGYLPHNDVLFAPRGRRILAVFRSLRQHTGIGGTAYYSPHKPQIEINGQPLTVAFSHHAMQRICERISLQWPAYGSQGDMFSLFNCCLEFEPCTLYPDELAFTFFARCGPNYWQELLAAFILGDDFDRDQRYSFRVGYCPAVIDGGFIKAKTVLFPGFSTTPEYGLIRSANMPIRERNALLEKATELSARLIWDSATVEDSTASTNLLGVRKSNLEDSEPLGVLKWFHDQGVPQIRVGWPAFAPEVELNDL